MSEKAGSERYLTRWPWADDALAEIDAALREAKIDLPAVVWNKIAQAVDEACGAVNEYALSVGWEGQDG